MTWAGAKEGREAATRPEGPMRKWAVEPARFMVESSAEEELETGEERERRVVCLEAAQVCVHVEDITIGN